MRAALRAAVFNQAPPLLRSNDMTTWLLTNATVAGNTFTDSSGSTGHARQPLLTPTSGILYTATFDALKDGTTSRMIGVGMFAASSFGASPTVSNVLVVMLNTSTGAHARTTGADTGSFTYSVVSIGSHWRVTISGAINAQVIQLRAYPAAGLVLGTLNASAQGSVTVDRVRLTPG